MGRTKKRVRAQRKFAQGAFVPTQSNPSSSGMSATLHAPHRLLSGPSPAPVVLNQCSPRDLVTHMSLGRLHSHNLNVPIVVLERSDLIITNKDALKRKLKEKRNLRTCVSKRRYMLRDRPRMASNLLDARRVSVSDSGEDAPLSRLVDTPVASSPPDESTAASDAVEVKSSLSTTSTLIIPKLDSSASVTKSSSSVTGVTNGAVVGATSNHLLSPSHSVKLSSRNNSSERDASMAKINVMQTPAASSHLANSNLMLEIPQENIALRSHAASNESHTPPVPGHERSSLDRSAGASGVPCEQLLCERKTLAPQRSLRPRRIVKSNQKSLFLYSGFSDISGLGSINTPSIGTSQDPDFRTSMASSVSSDNSLTTKRYNTLKKKALDRERIRNKIKKNKKTQDVSQALAEVDEDFPFTSASDTNSEGGFQMPNIDSLALTSEINMSEVNVRNIPITTNLMSTAAWIRNQSEIFTSPPCSTVSERRCPIPGSSSSEAIGSLGPTTPGGDMLIAPERHCLTPTNTEQPTCDNDQHFKMPKLPARFAKRTKNCPTRSFCDLQELLKSQPTETEPFCNICKRCELRNKFKKVASQLPVSLADEPDILEQRPRDVYEFDSDESGMKYLRRGRELVRNVLTTNKFPIWLSNLEMNLQMSMFQKEHQLGTLKRTIILKPNDIADEMVSKIILRVDYLARCIAEDKKELDEESKKRLRSSKRARSSAVSDFPRKNKPPTKGKKQAKVVKARRKPRQLASVPMDTALPTVPPVASPQALASVEPLSEAAPANPWHLMVGVTPIKNYSELARQSPVTPPAPTASPIQDRMLPQGRLSSEIRQNEQSSAPVSQPLLAKEDNTPLAQSLQSVEVSTSSTQIESIDCASPNQQEMDSHRDSSFDQPPIQQAPEQSTTPTPEPEMSGFLVYKPTLNEFKDPIAYIKTIEEEASKYGICKIIPPEPLNIPCHLDESCMFKTVNQYLGRLFQRWGLNCSELVAIQTHVAMLTQPREREQFTKVPLFDGLELDLVKLYQLVQHHGGIEELFAHDEKWARIAEQMCLASHRGKPDLKKLEKLYCKHVLPYESLSGFERRKIRHMLDNIWKLRLKAAVRRAKSPLHHQRHLLGYAASDDEEEDSMDAELRAVNLVAKPCFERIEECTGKGRSMNLATFRRVAAQVQAMRFGERSQLSTLEIEADYWQILSLGLEHVCVLSASIDTSVNKLGHTSDPAAPGGSHPWNLKRISDNPLNILRWLGKTLSVTVPTLSLNQLHSTNCWHRDPHKLAWLDYMHEGSTKIWYGVPSSGSRAFQLAAESVNPSAVQTKGTWLASDTTMLPPGTLIERGVPVHRVLQLPGEFVVVFPGAYACSIATGLTISESVYFENENWLNNVDDVFRELHQDCEPAMFSNTLLLMRMAQEPTLDSIVLRRVYNSIRGLFKKEFECRREAVRTKCRIQINQSVRADSEQTPISWPNQEECTICRVPLTLSKMSRSDEPRLLMCLPHGLRKLAVSEAPVCTQPPVVTLLYSNEELHKLVSDLEIRLLHKFAPATKESV